MSKRNMSHGRNMTILARVAYLQVACLTCNFVALMCITRMHGQITCSGLMSRDGDSRARGVRAVSTGVNVASVDHWLFACNKQDEES